MILCVNAGSSSSKLATFDGDRRVASTTVERIGPDVAAALGTALDAGLSYDHVVTTPSSPRPAPPARSAWCRPTKI
jgi:acetate kinase